MLRVTYESRCLVLEALRPIALYQGLYVGGERQVDCACLHDEFLFELFWYAQGEGNDWLGGCYDWPTGIPLHARNTSSVSVHSL